MSWIAATCPPTTRPSEAWRATGPPLPSGSTGCPCSSPTHLSAARASRSLWLDACCQLPGPTAVCDGAIWPQKSTGRGQQGAGLHPCTHRLGGVAQMPWGGRYPCRGIEAAPIGGQLNCSPVGNLSTREHSQSVLAMDVAQLVQYHTRAGYIALCAYNLVLYCDRGPLVQPAPGCRIQHVHRCELDVRA